MKLQNIHNLSTIKEISLSNESYTQTDKVDIFEGNSFLHSFEQKNNHFTHKGSLKIELFLSVSSSIYPRLCWTSQDEEEKPKSCRAYGYLKDLNRG